MKFTEEQAREALRAELTNKGRKSLAMSDRTLAKTTESLLKRLADDEMGLPDFVEIAIEILNPVNDNIRKDKSDFANKWKEEHTDGSSKTAPQGEGENSEMKALMERIAVLEADKKESDKKASIAQKRKEAKSKLKEKGVDDDDWVNNFLSEVNITEDFDIESKAEQWIKLYNKKIAKGGSATPPENPIGGTKGSKFASVIKTAGELAKNDKSAGIVQSN